MRPQPMFLVIAALVSCHSAPSPQPGPAPEGASAADTTVSLIALTRIHGAEPTVPDYTLLFTASGEVFYSGSPAIPAPGLFSGHISSGSFHRLASQLTAGGLAPATSGTSQAVTPQCHAAAQLTVSLQTANGHYAVTSFCAGSVQEKALAAPIYQATEATFWQPGMRRLTLVPPK